MDGHRVLGRHDLQHVHCDNGGALGTLSHIYADDGSYTATVKVTDSTGLSDSKSFTAAVTDPAVVALGGFTFTATEGAPAAVQAVATFTDPGGPEPNPGDPTDFRDHYSATIAWGDGTSSPGVIALDPATGVFTVSGGHTYGEDGSYTVTTTVDHEGVVTPPVISTATVSDPAVVAQGGFTFTATEGAPAAVQTVATFTDPGGPEPNASDPSTTGDPYVATIAWGDGSTSMETLANGGIVLGGDGKTFTVNLAHTYGEEGSYTIITTIAHENATPQMVASTATVSDPAVVATGVAVSALVGKPFSGGVVATFTDPGGPEAAPLWAHYSAMIAWGDGTSSPGAIALDTATGVFTVSGDHTYSKEGSYPITTSINHEGIVTTVAGASSGTATVKDSLGLLLLDPAGKDALNVTGNGSIVVNGYGAIIVDSSNSEAAIVTGNGTVSASDIDVTGGSRTTGQGSFSVPADHEAATPDPLGLPLPTAPSPNFTAVNYSGSTPLTLSPGTYVGGIKITGKGSVTLLPGIYYMKGGGFSVTGQGSITGSGVMIVNAPATSSDTINFTGQGNVTLTPSTTLSGLYAAYNGITIFQDPASSAPINVTGQGHLAVTGAIYAPGATLNLTGQGGMELDGDSTHGIDAQCIAFDLTVTGNGDLTVNNKIVDTTAPVVTYTGPVFGTATHTNPTVSGNVSDPLSGVASLVGQIDTGPTFPVTFDASGNFSFSTALPLDGTADGTHTVHVVATDKAGNVSASYDDTFVLDTRPPMVTYTGPASGSTTDTNPTVAGQVSDSLSGVASLVGQVDAGPTFPVAVDAAGGFSFATSLSLDGTADGTHTVHVVATDKAGNVSASYDDTFVLDTTPPAVTYTGPAAGSATDNNPIVTGKVADALSGVASLVGQVDAGPTFPVAFDPSTGAFSFPTALALDGTADGVHVVRLRATDRAGNISGPFDDSFVLDTTSPVVAYTGPTPGTAMRINPTIAGRVSDAPRSSVNTTGMVSLVGQVDTGATFPVILDAAGNFSFTTALALDGTADGVHTVHLKATDKAGNVSAAFDDTFVLDTTPPVVTYTSPATGSATRTNPTVTGQVSDTLSGVASLVGQVDAGRPSR